VVETQASKPSEGIITYGERKEEREWSWLKVDGPIYGTTAIWRSESRWRSPIDPARSNCGRRRFDRSAPQSTNHRGSRDHRGAWGLPARQRHHRDRIDLSCSSIQRHCPPYHTGRRDSSRSHSSPLRLFPLRKTKQGQDHHHNWPFHN
jgi:hypothetical protein